MYNNNVVSDRNMGETSETEMKVNSMQVIAQLTALNRMIYELEQRLTRMERAYDALGRRLEGSERHIEDEGWFD